MNIGFDAKRAFNNFTGLGNYSRTLIETLAQFYPENTYHLFTPKLNTNPRIADFLENPSIKVHTPAFPLNKISPLWRSFFINEDILRSDVSIFHGLSHELPIGLPKKIKQVVTVHDLIQERYPEYYNAVDRKIYTLKLQQACRQSNVVVAISEQTKNDLVYFLKIDPQKIRVIYQSCDFQFSIDNGNQIENRKSKIENRYDLPENYILYVGTVNERKNLLTLVKAVEQLKNTPDEINLVAIGDGGAYFKLVQDYMVQKKLEKLIYLRPKVDFEDMPAIYRAAKIFIYPSFFEGFGIPIIEALWSGVPVITSIGSCFSEAGGKNSIYINPHQPEVIAEAIKKINNDSDLRQMMITSGRLFAENFRAEKIGSEWIDLYKSLN